MHSSNKVRVETLNPLIDGDIICYRAGFAKEPDGVDNEQRAIQRVKTSLGNILGAFPERSYSRLFLTGKGNYRDQVAVTQPYKGNRDTSHKPTFYKEIRTYLIDVEGAELIEGMEADDALGIAQYDRYQKGTPDTVICSTDKDLLMIPGYHYRWTKKEFLFVDDYEAMRHFFFQMLTGDPTDNIRGLDQYGPVRANALLEKTERRFGNNVTALKRAVLEAYEQKLGSEKGMARYLENGSLLWIKREDNSNPPTA